MASISIEEFLNYVRAFNARDYKTQHSFYHPQVTLLIPDPRIPLLKGSQGIMDHYSPLHRDYDEILVPIEVMVNQRRIFFSMETYFVAKKAIKGGTAEFDYEKGDVSRVRVWALYDMEGGKMKHITCNLLEAEFFGSEKKLEDWVKESEGRAAPDVRLT